MATMDELVLQVQELESATTDLLEATNISKKTLDTSVDKAKGSAQSAANSEAIVTPAKNETIAAKNEAVQAKNEAVAIVHNDEGSLTSKAGAYPLGDANGHLHIGWTPLLQAMYPYSGVIGSVDKDDLFQFAQVDTWQNRLVITAETRRFNINGRFVGITPDISLGRYFLLLPEAESTAARAIAFDDIFLDWDGNVVTYRSITPHRTTTGYDRDAIASEHGYTKVQTGLYRTSDSKTHLLLLGRVARRNQGAFEPQLNPEGANTVWLVGSAERRHAWHRNDSKNITSKEDCFDLGDWEDHICPPGIGIGGAGNIATSFSGRPSSAGTGTQTLGDLYHDAIYADDFTPLYYSAQNVIDRQALLFDNFNRAVAGETFSGAEGTSQLIPYYVEDVSADPDLVTFNGNKYGIGNYRMGSGVRVRKQLNNERYVNSNWLDFGQHFCFVAWVTSARGRELCYLGPQYSYSAAVTNRAIQPVTETEYLADDIGVTKVEYVGAMPLISYSDGRLVARTTNLIGGSTSKRPQFLACDIIGALDAMPQEWLDNGIPGNWLAVDEDGNSLIPDGTSKAFKLSRKCRECYLVLFTQDNGVTWQDITATWKASVEGSSNSNTVPLPADGVDMIFYRTASNPFELSENAMVSSIQTPYSVSSHSMVEGSTLVSGLINKVPTQSAGILIGNLHLKTESIRIRYLVSNSFSTPIENEPLQLRATTSPAIKILPVLLEDFNGIQLIYKELKHNGTSWGDDNKFNIVNNQSTVTDLNGKSCIVGQKKLETFHQFNGDTY